MKTLVVFYSRTGFTKKAALQIAKSLKADSEEIFDINERRGMFGYLKSGKESISKIIPEIKETKKDASNYDLVIIGTPIWAWNVSSPIRAYIEKNKYKFKKIAFFCTQGGSGSKNAFAEMKSLCKKDPVAVLTLKTSDVQNDDFATDVRFFCERIKKNLK